MPRCLDGNHAISTSQSPLYDILTTTVHHLSQSVRHKSIYHPFHTVVIGVFCVSCLSEKLRMNCNNNQQVLSLLLPSCSSTGRVSRRQRCLLFLALLALTIAYLPHRTIVVSDIHPSVCTLFVLIAGFVGNRLTNSSNRSRQDDFCYQLLQPVDNY